MKFKKTIAVDFDGVLNNYKGYDARNLGTPRKNVEKFLKELSNDYTIIIFTSRNHSLVRHWLVENHLDKYIHNVTNSKPPAVAYIDDRAVNFSGDYDKVLDDVKDFKAFWEN